MKRAYRFCSLRQLSPPASWREPRSLILVELTETDLTSRRSGIIFSGGRQKFA